MTDFGTVTLKGMANMKHRFQWFFAVGVLVGSSVGIFGTSLVQANDLKDLFKGYLKSKIVPPAQEPRVTPAAPVTPEASPEKPAEQLLKAFMSGNVSEQDEARIGQQIAGNLLGAAPLVRDDGLQRYVNRVGRWVALQTERPDLNWHFGVIESDDLNAFAAPGGYIFLTKGLYQRLNSEAELTGVLGHEIGHVLRKHHLKLFQKSQGIAAIGGLLGRKLKNENEILQNVIGNGAEVVARGLDKDAEYEADRIGVVLSARSGYDAYALPAVLAEMGHVAKDDKRVSLLFKTHPLPEDRLSHLSEAVADKLDVLPEGQSGAQRLYRLR